MMSLDPGGEALSKNHKAEQNIPYTIKTLIRCLPFLRHLPIIPPGSRLYHTPHFISKEVED